MVTPGVLRTYELLVNVNIRRRGRGRCAQRHIAGEYSQETVEFDGHCQDGIAVGGAGEAATLAGTVTAA